MRRSFVVLALLSLLTIGFHGAATPESTQAAGIGCARGDVALADRITASGNYFDMTVAVNNAANSSNDRITIRYSAAHNCAFGVYTSNSGWTTGGRVWLDLSWNGGANWDGHVLFNQRVPAYSINTGTFDMNGPYNAVRACGEYVVDKGFGPSTFIGIPPSCTPWFFPGRMYGNQILSSPKFDRITSPNGRFVLVMQGDGNLVQYEYATGRVMWAKYSKPGTILKMQTDGNLVLIAPGNIPVWSTGTGGRGTFVNLQNDGNLVVYGPSGAVWANYAK